SPAIFHANRRWQVQIINGLLYRGRSAAQVSAFETPCNRNVALQVFAANLSLRRQFGYRRQRSESSRAPTATGKQRVAHRFKRRTIPRRKAHPNRIGSVVVHHRSGGGFAFEDGGGIGSDFFRRESGPRSHARVHL